MPFMYLIIIVDAISVLFFIYNSIFILVLSINAMHSL